MFFCFSSLPLDVDVVANFGGDDVDPARLGEGQEGAESQQVDGGDEGEHGRPRARRLDEVPREVNHQDACRRRRRRRESQQSQQTKRGSFVGAIVRFHKDKQSPFFFFWIPRMTTNCHRPHPLYYSSDGAFDAICTTQAGQRD